MLDDGTDTARSDGKSDTSSSDDKTDSAPPDEQAAGHDSSATDNGSQNDALLWGVDQPNPEDQLG
jgi:hypothetical protein